MVYMAMAGCRDTAINKTDQVLAFPRQVLEGELKGEMGETGEWQAGGVANTKALRQASVIMGEIKVVEDPEGVGHILDP